MSCNTQRVCGFCANRLIGWEGRERELTVLSPQNGVFFFCEVEVNRYEVVGCVFLLVILFHVGDIVISVH